MEYSIEIAGKEMDEAISKLVEANKEYMSSVEKIGSNAEEHNLDFDQLTALMIVKSKKMEKEVEKIYE